MSLKLLKTICDSEGYDTITANDGKEAMDILLTDKIDLIVTDVLMPNIDGYYLCYKVRTNEKLKHIPIIVYTATYTSQSEEMMALEMGADMFIRKPAAMKVLLSALQHTLANPRNHILKFSGLPQSFEIMHQYSSELVTKLEYRNIELEQITQNLRTAETNYREIFDKANDAIYVQEISTGKILETNQKASEITGYTKEELLRGNLKDFITGNPEYGFKKAMEYIQKAAAGTPQLFEWLGKNKDGSYNWLEINLKKAIIAGEERILAFFREINDRKKNEEKIQKLNEELEQKVINRTIQLEEANKELESFSYSVSHDLRAPLRSVMAYSKILDEDYSTALDPEGKRRLNIINKNALRMNKLIDDLLEFSMLSRQELRKSDVDTEKVVRGILEEFKNSSSYSGSIIVNPLSPVRADHAMLTQVWTNLISNALKYSAKKEDSRIEIGYNEGRELVFYVKDNGAGFDMEYAHKLFGVFQRLHTIEEFEGTGVGLSIVKRIITKHGGRVWAEGKVDEGATFYFTLPQQ